MPEKLKTPAIRFKGFTDAWEEGKLSNVAGVYDGVHQTPDYQNEGIMFLSVENIATLTSEKYISEEAYDRDYKMHPEKGDILMTRIGDVGTPNVVETNVKLGYYVSLALLKPKGIDSFFLNNAILSASFQRGLRERTLLTAIPMKINKDEIGKVDIYYSKNPDEQHKIGESFRQLDNLIAFYQQKYEKLLNIKKSMLEKMFPRNGAKVPEIRFKGFAGAWEERKLSDIGDVVTGSTPSTQHPEYYSENGIPWVTPTDITENIISDTPRKLSTIGTQVGRVVPSETILVTCIASIGKNAMLANEGSFNQQINGLVPNKQEYDPYFLLTESYHWSVKMKREAAAGTMQIVNKNEFSAIETFVPRLSEQQAIGRCFRKMDNLITLHQRKLEKLKNIKKVCLEKMFV